MEIAIVLSNRPYLLRAFYEWIDDSGWTPILVINATNPRCKIPRDYVEDGEIVFNISSVAVRNLKISNDFIEFKASFSSVIHLISAPISAIIAIYAEENGEGLFFDCDGISFETDEFVKLKALDGIDPKSLNDHTPRSPKPTKPFLKLVE